MIKRTYLAFINHNFPVPWQKLSNDLNQCIPNPFARLEVDLDLKLFYSEERNQYHSTLILSEILNYLPSDGQKIIGITNVDIYIPILTFLFGEAQLEGKGAIVSTFRLRNEFYGLPRDDDLLYIRTLKEVIHELGHTMGLIHCHDFLCAMHFSTSVEDIDLKKPMFCPECQKKLRNTSLMDY